MPVQANPAYGTKEASEFPWTYDAEETCYFLEGNVTVTPAEDEAFRIGKGDLVTFQRWISRLWHIHRDVRKHYIFRSDTKN